MISFENMKKLMPLFVVYSLQILHYCNGSAHGRIGGLLVGSDIQRNSNSPPHFGQSGNSNVDLIWSHILEIAGLIAGALMQCVCKKYGKFAQAMEFILQTEKWRHLGIPIRSAFLRPCDWTDEINQGTTRQHWAGTFCGVLFILFFITWTKFGTGMLAAIALIKAVDNKFSSRDQPCLPLRHDSSRSRSGTPKRGIKKPQNGARHRGR